jgi:microcystin-dependent protein
MNKYILITIFIISVLILVTILYFRKEKYTYAGKSWPVSIANQAKVTTISKQDDLYILTTDSSGNIGKTANVPIGAILMWSGQAVQQDSNLNPTNGVPVGWAICDGTNGTPDLRSRFIVGAQGTNQVAGTDLTGYNTGDMGGEEFHQLTVPEMPSHNHLANIVGGSDQTYEAPYASTDVGDQSFRLTTFTGGDPNNIDANGNPLTLPHNNMPPFYALAYIMKTYIN